MRGGTAPRAVRLRLDLGYDGTGFAGWAEQPGLRTVQGELTAALGRVLRLEPAPRLTVAGRTDSGVHASGQVAHVDVPAEALAAAPGRSGSTPEEALLRRLAGVLPADVRVHAVRRAPDGFDARFSASRRRYAYRVSDHPAGVPPLRRHDVLGHRRSLDVAAMDAASRALVGLHDFAAYCKPRQGATTVRTLLEYSWRREEVGPDAGLLVADVRADAFCHSMVRALVGAALAVGEGRREADWPAHVLLRGLRDPAVAVVPAHGLCLEEVVYPPDADLAARARQARAVRPPLPPRPGGPAAPAR
ncbi:tRNA pseudouridine(38-40) synthase TruA [Kineococcus arenarius]|uniref:tRNA pseudouridine(38-40) synthase TruA n=1 Tax=unclassified Kineococcus TaxID=2621656 RepID=UPI003D7EC1F7